MEACRCVPKKVKCVPPVGKIMATVFWEGHGVVLIGYLEKGKTIIGENYTLLLEQLEMSLRPSIHIWLGQKCFSTTTMCAAHTSSVVTTKHNLNCYHTHHTH